MRTPIRRLFGSVYTPGVEPPPPLPGGLLLDAYPGAASAHSTRKILTSYTGAVIRVRRSSDNAEQDIGFASDVLDTTALLSFVGANDGFVTTWYDQTGNGRHLIQATAANQPRIVLAGVVDVLNGKPVLTFDGSNDFLRATYTLNQPCLYDIVLKVLATGLSVHYVNGVTGNAALYNNGTNYAVFAGNVFSSAIAVASNLTGVLTGLLNGTSSQIRHNANTSALGNASTLNPGGVTLAASNTGTASSNIQTPELVIYPSSPGFVSSLISDQRTYYGV